MTNALSKFQQLLRELFQLESADELDFGIYRIINQRRTLVEDWIAKALPSTVKDALGQGIADEDFAKRHILFAQGSNYGPSVETIVNQN